MGWWLPVVAFAAMLCQDVLGVVMVQSEAGNRARLAASMDTAGDVRDRDPVTPPLPEGANSQAACAA